jgi:hypothetical protein
MMLSYAKNRHPGKTVVQNCDCSRFNTISRNVYVGASREEIWHIAKAIDVFERNEQSLMDVHESPRIRPVVRVALTELVNSLIEVEPLKTEACDTRVWWQDSREARWSSARVSRSLNQPKMRQGGREGRFVWLQQRSFGQKGTLRCAPPCFKRIVLAATVDLLRLCPYG